MFRDTSEELARLEAELLAEEEPEEELLPEEEDSWEYEEEYPNYANGYQVYNTDQTDEDLEYYSEEVRAAYKTVEENACKSLIEMLPEDFREEFAPCLIAKEGDEEIWKLIKAADKISALIKCLEEKKAGNSEFVKAGEGIEESIRRMGLPETEVFIEEFLPAYEMTLDELRD